MLPAYILVCPNVCIFYVIKVTYIHTTFSEAENIPTLHNYYFNGTNT